MRIMDKFACPQAPKQLKDMECSSTRDYNPPWKNTITWEHQACTSKKYDYSLTIDPCPGQTTIQAVLQFKCSLQSLSQQSRSAGSTIRSTRGLGPGCSGA